MYVCVCKYEFFFFFFYLQPPRDRNMTQHSNNLLAEVVECLESMPNRENTEVNKLVLCNSKCLKTKKRYL